MFLPEFIEIGLDVIHPIQKNTMKEEEAFLMKTYDRPEGLLMLTMGNASTPDWKQENLDAVYQASLEYGAI